MSTGPWTEESKRANKQRLLERKVISIAPEKTRQEKILQLIDTTTLTKALQMAFDFFEVRCQTRLDLIAESIAINYDIKMTGGHS